MLEFIIRHDGRWWIACNDDLEVRGLTLDDLDSRLGDHFSRNCSISEKDITVRMNFDNSAIPEWIRQYSNHYFNRIVRINLEK